MVRKTGKDIRVAMDKDHEARKVEYGGYEKYEVEGWASTLQSAAEIISDTKKMKAIAKCLEKKEKSLSVFKAFAAGKVKQ